MRIRLVQAIVVSAVLMLPAFAQATTISPVAGVPGPIAGAGLPLFAVGYGVYWLIKRRRRVDS
jgi:hypothetical protein